MEERAKSLPYELFGLILATIVIVLVGLFLFFRSSFLDHEKVAEARVLQTPVLSHIDLTPGRAAGGGWYDGNTHGPAYLANFQLDGIESDDEVLLLDRSGHPYEITPYTGKGFNFVVRDGIGKIGRDLQIVVRNDGGARAKIPFPVLTPSPPRSLKGEASKDIRAVLVHVRGDEIAALRFSTPLPGNDDRYIYRILGTNLAEVDEQWVERRGNLTRGFDVPNLLLADQLEVEEVKYRPEVLEDSVTIKSVSLYNQYGTPTLGVDESFSVASSLGQRIIVPRQRFGPASEDDRGRKFAVLNLSQPMEEGTARLGETAPGLHGVYFEVQSVDPPLIDPKAIKINANFFGVAGSEFHSEFELPPFIPRPVGQFQEGSIKAMKLKIIYKVRRLVSTHRLIVPVEKGEMLWLR